MTISRKAKASALAADHAATRRRNLRRWLFSAGLAALVITLSVAGWNGWRSYAVRERVIRALPAPPVALAAQPILRAKIAAAEEAARGYRSAPSGLGQLGRLYQANGFLAEASQAYEGLCRIEPQNPRWPYFLATILAGYGRLDSALPLLQRTIGLAPDYLPAKMQLAEALMKTGRSDEAAAVYQAVLASEPANAYAELGLARLAIAGQRWTEARDRLQKITGGRPDFAPAWSLLAGVKERTGDTAGLEAVRRRGLNSGLHVLPDPWLNELMLDCYDLYRLDVAAVGAAARDPAKAIRWLQRAVELDPAHAASHRLLGEQYQQKGDQPAARQHLERATELQPEEDKNWISLVDFFNTSGDAAASEQALARGLKACPQSSALLFEHGRQLVIGRRFAEAREALQESLRLNPERVEAHVGLGLAFFNLGRAPDGLTEMQAALQLDPGNPVALVTVAINAIELGDATVARTWIMRARQQSGVAAQTLLGMENKFRAKFGEEP